MSPVEPVQSRFHQSDGREVVTASQRGLIARAVVPLIGEVHAIRDVGGRGSAFALAQLFGDGRHLRLEFIGSRVRNRAKRGAKEQDGGAAHDCIIDPALNGRLGL